MQRRPQTSPSPQPPNVERVASSFDEGEAEWLGMLRGALGLSPSSRIRPITPDEADSLGLSEADIAALQRPKSDGRRWNRILSAESSAGSCTFHFVKVDSAEATPKISRGEAEWHKNAFVQKVPGARSVFVAPRSFFVADWPGAGKRTFLVFDWVPSATLAAFLQPHAPPPFRVDDWQWVVGLYDLIAAFFHLDPDGLGTTHLIYTDLKLDQILVTRKDHRLRFIDLGLASLSVQLETGLVTVYPSRDKSTSPEVREKFSEICSSVSGLIQDEPLQQAVRKALSIMTLYGKASELKHVLRGLSTSGVIPLSLPEDTLPFSA